MIHNSELIIRKTVEADLGFIIRTESDPSNSSFVAQWSLSEHQQALTDESIIHAIIENNKQDMIGYMIVTGLLNPHRSICLQRIVVSHKGFGYGQTAINLIIQWLFDMRSAHRVWLDVKAYNQRAIHIYEKLGFIREGILRECYLSGDTFESLVVMSMLEREYRQRRV